MNRTLRPFVILALAAIPALVSNGTLAAVQADPCKKAADDLLRACRLAAQADTWLATATCDNMADRADRRSCERDAADTQREALQECSAQNTARLQTCRRLGGGVHDPEIDPADFVDVIDNPYFPLTPGTTLVYEAKTPEGLERVSVTVTHTTRVVAGVTCVEVHDVETRDGELIEDTLDWFAQDRDGNVWYFGENSARIEGALIVSVDGSWAAGVDGAKPGLIMKAHPTVGDFYRQEFFAGTAEDLGAVVSLNESVTVPYGSFDGCVKTEDTTPLEPDALENKYYAPGIGVVLEIDPESGERVELVQIIHE
jgi:hypothetical protein